MESYKTTNAHIIQAIKSHHDFQTCVQHYATLHHVGLSEPNKKAIRSWWQSKCLKYMCGQSAESLLTKTDTEKINMITFELNNLAGSDHAKFKLILACYFGPVIRAAFIQQPRNISHTDYSHLYAQLMALSLQPDDVSKLNTMQNARQALDRQHQPTVDSLNPNW